MRNSPIPRAAPRVLATYAAVAVPASARVRRATSRPKLGPVVARREGREGRVTPVPLDRRTRELPSQRGSETLPTAGPLKVPVLVELFHRVAGPSRTVRAWLAGRTR